MNRKVSTLELSQTDQNRRTFVESYLQRKGCTELRYERDGEHIFSVSLNSHRCQLWIAQEWAEIESTASVDERLDRLEVIPFMQYNSLAWVGRKAGKEVIQHIPPQQSAQHGLARTVKKLLDSRITAPVTVQGRTGE